MSCAKINIRLKSLNFGFRSWNLDHWKLYIESLATDNLDRKINFDKSFEISVDLFLQSANYSALDFQLKQPDCIRDAAQQELDY